MYQLTASIVTFNTDYSLLKACVVSFLNTTLNVKLCIVDNSPNDALKQICSEDLERVCYMKNDRNIGFGSAHNIAIERFHKTTQYHLVLNPDIFFEGGVLETLFEFMNINRDIGVVCPKVKYMNGELQYICRKLPTPFDFIVKRMIPFSLKGMFKKRIDAYEFKDKDYSQTMVVPFISGCFMFVRSEVFSKVGLFDENIFMYTEDADFSRRVNKYYKTIYYPKSEIFHGYARESAKNIKLLKIAIESSIYYFNKWGWFIDQERREINKTAGQIYE